MKVDSGTKQQKLCLSIKNKVAVLEPLTKNLNYFSKH